MIRDPELAEKIEEIALIGTWEVDLKKGSVYWSKVTKIIHEVDQEYEPDLERGINFYKEGHYRELISQLFGDCVSQQKSFDSEFILVTAKGNEKWVRSIGTPVIENGECTHVKGTFQDIDQSKKLVEKLSESESLFRGVFEKSSIGIALVGLDGSWLKVNKSICTLLGYDEDDLLKLTFQDVTHPDDLNIDLDLLNDVIDGKRSEYEMEKRYFHKKGGIIWAHLAVSLMRDENENPLYFISQITNLTKRKNAESELKNYLDITQEQNKRLTNFAHIVSHNLRSHTVNMELMANITEYENPKIVETESFQSLKRALNNLSEAVDNLSEVAVLNTQKSLVLKKIQVSTYINKAIINLSGSSQDKKYTIENRIDDDVYVMAHPAYLESIILNLMTNAIKYRSTERSGHLTITCQKNKETTCLAFKDNGLGVDLSLHGSKIFGMFKTFHEVEDSKGLGLFMSKNQVEAMNGKIEVSSEVDKGSTFTIYLKNEES